MSQGVNRCLPLLVCLAATVTLSAAENQPFRKLTDIPYAKVDGHILLLDLYLPSDRIRPAPLVVFVHGGAWRSGSKQRMPLTGLVRNGLAVASVDYRLSPVARFPAQIHDLKAAIRFLRAKRQDYGYNARRVAIAGTSAGGHLAALVGVTNGHERLEGRVGEHLDESSDVHAIVSFFGAGNLLTILPQSTPLGLRVRIPALQLLLGAQPEDRPELAALASPLFHVDKTDPALLLLHGDQDSQMPINQAHELHGKYKKHDLPVQFVVVHGAGHGGKEFGEYYDGRRTRLLTTFLDAHLKSK